MLIYRGEVKPLRFLPVYFQNPLEPLGEPQFLSPLNPPYLCTTSTSFLWLSLSKNTINQSIDIRWTAIAPWRGSLDRKYTFIAYLCSYHVASPAYYRPMGVSSSANVVKSINLECWTAPRCREFSAQWGSMTASSLDWQRKPGGTIYFIFYSIKYRNPTPFKVSQLFSCWILMINGGSNKLPGLGGGRLTW